MATLEEFQHCFAPEEVPDALVKLIAFEATQHQWFSAGFELSCDSMSFKTYSENPEFLESLFAIAQADNTGSIYAIWRQGGRVSDSPIVAFGSEGGAHVVAENLVGLFRILSLDAEPMIGWDKVIYYKSNDAQPSERSTDYGSWLTETFKANPVNDATEAMQIVTRAQALHEMKFQKWLKRFYG